MAPTPYVAPVVSSESIFKADLFKGKVLFCTGGGSGICRAMTESMVRIAMLYYPLLLTFDIADASRRKRSHSRTEVSSVYFSHPINR